MTPGDDPSEPGQWAGERVERWLRAAPGLERQMVPISDLLFAAARLAPGERVLDVGCGTGPTTWQAAALVGPSGAVTGIDVAAEMVDAARAAAPTDDAPRADPEWVVADVSRWEARGGSYDAVISRFGVMFFDDPAQAFSNLARVTRPGGRLVVVVWPDRRRVPMFEVPLDAALEERRRLGCPPMDAPPPDEGPFSLGDEAVLRDLLDGAGWVGVDVAAHRLLLPIGGGVGPDAAAESTMQVGPTRVVTADLDEGSLAAVQAAVASALAAHVDHGQVALEAEVLVVSARRP